MLKLGSACKLLIIQSVIDKMKAFNSYFNTSPKREALLIYLYTKGAHKGRSKVNFIWVCSKTDHLLNESDLVGVPGEENVVAPQHACDNKFQLVTGEKDKTVEKANISFERKQ